MAHRKISQILPLSGNGCFCLEISHKAFILTSFLVLCEERKDFHEVSWLMKVKVQRREHAEEFLHAPEHRQKRPLR